MLSVCGGLWYRLGREPKLPPGKARAWDVDPGPGPREQYTPDKMTRTSQYLTMRDGVKLAIDFCLPKGLAPGTRLPALLFQTRYYRGTELRWPFSRFMTAPGLMRPEFFVLNGYAFVTVDARGTGASFGSRVSDFSAEEVADGKEIVDWIIRQPWSDGKVGGFGGSYMGITAELLLSNMHPAVKAAAVVESPYDWYADVGLPGGIRWRALNEEWSRRNGWLDQNRMGQLLSWWQSLALKGVRPVDSDPTGAMLAGAVREHAKNYHYFGELQSVTFRDDRFGASTLERVSPFHFQEQIRAAGVPIYSFGGWYDLFPANAPISRFLTVPNAGNRLTIGPWNHNLIEISPGEERRAQAFSVGWEAVKFFDYHLKGIRREADPDPIHYWTVGEEKWKSAATWPPPGAQAVDYYLAPGHTLSTSRPAGGDDRYRVDNDTGRGNYTRWATPNGDSGEGYIHTSPNDAKLLVYESDPLSDAVEVTGNPELTLWLTSTAADGEFFVYLEDVGAGGKAVYVTEGLLRGLHRRIGTGAAPYVVQGVWHSFQRADAQPLVPGEPAELKINLIPISYLFRPGHRLRVALAGADKDHFDLLPGPAPEWRVLRDPAHPSRIVLPMIRR